MRHLLALFPIDREEAQRAADVIRSLGDRRVATGAALYLLALIALAANCVCLAILFGPVGQ